MDTSRRTRRLGILWLIGLLVVTHHGTPPNRLYGSPGNRRAPPERQRHVGRRRMGVGIEEARRSVHIFNLRNADIVQVIDLISELTGKSFLVDDKVRGKVAIIAPTR